MTTSPLIDAPALNRMLQANPADVLVVDCSFDLSDAGAGRRAYEAGHLPNAVYMHLEDALSAPKTGRNGRHPLPERAAFAEAMSAAGFGLETGAAHARPRGGFTLRETLTRTVDCESVKANLATQPRLVVDARAPDRYRGENETMDPVGGHIPGAANRLFRNNLEADGCFKPAAPNSRPSSAAGARNRW